MLATVLPWLSSPLATVTCDPQGMRIAKYFTAWERGRGGRIAAVRDEEPDTSLIMTVVALGTTIPSTNAIGQAVSAPQVIPPLPDADGMSAGLAVSSVQAGSLGGRARVKG